MIMEKIKKEIELIKDSGLFDSEWYLSSYPDVELSGIDPIVHFVKYGSKLGRKSRREADFGEAKPASSEDLADTKSENNSASIKKIISNEKNPKNELKENINLVAASSFFDKGWYLSEYRDVALKGIDPVSHYVRNGRWEGRNPGPLFNTKWYMAEYREKLADDINPLVHYLRYGRREGCLPSPPEAENDAWWSRFNPSLKSRLGSDLASKSKSYNVMATINFSNKTRNPPAIIIPVYNAPDEVEDCLQSIIRNTKEDCRVIVINDASPDPKVRELLKCYTETNKIEIYHNEKNLGFTRTVNRGVELAGRSDVIFLNSDTKVTPGWLRNLRLAVYSGEKVGTATPFSNNAGAFSAPEMGKQNNLPSWISLDDYARAITQASMRAYPRVPTGNGFCMYIRRDCLDEVGPLDATAFPRGYGEENDFCMRAGRLGWQHVVDDATLIYHVRSASFGDAKTDLMKQGRAIIDQRYPEYTTAVRTAFSSAEIISTRDRVKETINVIGNEKAIKPRILFVISTLTGGTPQTNQDLMGALSDKIEAFVLRCNSCRITLMHYKDGSYVDMEMHILSEPIKAFPHRSAEYDAVVANWLSDYAIEMVHVRHIAWHSLGLIDVSKMLGLPVAFSFHDFYAVCPTVKLLDEGFNYCAGKCTGTQGYCKPELWLEPDFPNLKNGAIYQWRKAFSEVLSKCDVFITTAESAKRTMVECYPFMKDRQFHVIPHGRDFSGFKQLASELHTNDVIKIVIPGNISKAKGADIVLELAEKSHSAGIEIHIVGNVSKDLAGAKNIIFHGSYQRDEFDSFVEKIKPHVGAIFSIWPETYCHTLTELWACGVPVIAFDYGAVGDRIRESGGGWLISQPTTEEVVMAIMNIRRNFEDYLIKVNRIEDWQKHTSEVCTCHKMSREYLDVYNQLFPVAIN